MTDCAALFAATTLLLGFAAALSAHAATVGDVAPLFEADSSAGPISLADYRGKKNVLVAFYFADFTSG